MLVLSTLLSLAWDVILSQGKDSPPNDEVLSAMLMSSMSFVLFMAFLGKYKAWIFHLSADEALSLLVIYHIAPPIFCSLCKLLSGCMARTDAMSQLGINGTALILYCLILIFAPLLVWQDRSCTWLHVLLGSMIPISIALISILLCGPWNLSHNLPKLMLSSLSNLFVATAWSSSSLIVNWILMVTVRVLLARIPAVSLVYTCTRVRLALGHAAHSVATDISQKFHSLMFKLWQPQAVILAKQGSKVHSEQPAAAAASSSYRQNRRKTIKGPDESANRWEGGEKQSCDEARGPGPQRSLLGATRIQDSKAAAAHANHTDVHTAEESLDDCAAAVSAAPTRPGSHETKPTSSSGVTAQVLSTLIGLAAPHNPRSRSHAAATSPNAPQQAITNPQTSEPAPTHARAGPAVASPVAVELRAESTPADHPRRPSLLAQTSSAAQSPPPPRLHLAASSTRRVGQAEDSGSALRRGDDTRARQPGNAATAPSALSGAALAAAGSPRWAPAGPATGARRSPRWASAARQHGLQGDEERRRVSGHGCGERGTSDDGGGQTESSEIRRGAVGVHGGGLRRDLEAREGTTRCAERCGGTGQRRCNGEEEAGIDGELRDHDGGGVGGSGWRGGEGGDGRDVSLDMAIDHVPLDTGAQTARRQPACESAGVDSGKRGLEPAAGVDSGEAQKGDWSRHVPATGGGGGGWQGAGEARGRLGGGRLGVGKETLGRGGGCGGSADSRYPSLTGALRDSDRRSDRVRDCEALPAPAARPGPSDSSPKTTAPAAAPSPLRITEPRDPCTVRGGQRARRDPLFARVARSPPPAQAAPAADTDAGGDNVGCVGAGRRSAGWAADAGRRALGPALPHFAADAGWATDASGSPPPPRRYEDVGLSDVGSVEKVSRHGDAGIRAAAERRVGREAAAGVRGVENKARSGKGGGQGAGSLDADGEQAVGEDEAEKGRRGQDDDEAGRRGREAARDDEAGSREAGSGDDVWDMGVDGWGDEDLGRWSRTGWG